MKKILLGIVLLVLVGIAGGVWWVYRSLDSQVASAIRTYGPEIAGVPVSLSSVKIGLADGSVALRGLVVGNPPGFKTEHALSLATISITLDIHSLTKDVILIKEISIVKPDATYEYASDGSNLDVIQRNIKRYVAKHLGGISGSKSTEPGKKFIIEHIDMTNGTANASAAILNGKTISVSLPDLHLKDIGKQSHGATAGEAAQQIMDELTDSVTKSVLPLNLGNVTDSIKKGAETAVDAIKGLFK